MRFYSNQKLGHVTLTYNSNSQKNESENKKLH